MRHLRLAACLGVGASLSSPEAAPLNIVQTAPTNIVTIIQQRNSVISIDRQVTASTRNVTVTEITRIGPDPVPVKATQTGSANVFRAIQQGREPTLDLRQTGSSNRSQIVQTIIP